MGLGGTHPPDDRGECLDQALDALRLWDRQDIWGGPGVGEDVPEHLSLYRRLKTRIGHSIIGSQGPLSIQ